MPAILQAYRVPHGKSAWSLTAGPDGPVGWRPGGYLPTGATSLSELKWNRA
jgi:hypothetical protein